MQPYKCGILIISDSSFLNEKNDLSGKIILEEIKKIKLFEDIRSHIVADDTETIKTSLMQWSDEDKLDLVLTTGGTGFTIRDVTPEATKSVIEKEALAISQAMLNESLRMTKFAMLSRGVSGIRKSTLIINLPGSPKAVKECVTYLSPIFKHALDQLRGKHDTIKICHKKMQTTPTTTVSTLPHDVMSRPRSSLFKLISVLEAPEIVLSNTKRSPPIVLNLEESLNMVTASTIYSQVNVPPFPASIKDGYAVLFIDGAGIREVISVSNAGDDVITDSMLSNKCVRISTGAEIPRGSDSVVQVEDTELVDDIRNVDKESYINIIKAPEKLGQDIRPIGNDLKIGEILFSEDIVIGPSEIGLLAMGGVDRVSCYRRPTVGVMSTGNELISNTEEKKQKRIIDCNRPLLLSLYKSHNCNVVDLGIVLDEPQAILDALLASLKSCDVIVTTGGVSMGEKDYLKSVLVNDLKAEIHFGRILMKPGKPTTFSTLCNESTHNEIKLIFSLPGNPVSAFVTSHLFVVPSLKKMAGFVDYKPVHLKAKLRHNITLDERPDYRRCKLWAIERENGIYVYEVSSEEFGNQMSSRLSSCVAANGLLCLPSLSEAKCNQLSKGCEVSVLKLYNSS